MVENDIRRKVLIVDDEPKCQAPFRATILSKKFDVFEAENGIQAIEMAKAQKTGHYFDGYDDA